MRKFVILLGVVLVQLSIRAQSGTVNYVLQSDFGDTQNNGHPTQSADWTFLNYWNDVSVLGHQTDWIGHTHHPYGNSSTHSFYVSLDDSQNEYGAISGRIQDLEYRLVRCAFDYRVFDENDSNAVTDPGQIWILLANSENDIRTFDHQNPAGFEDSGIGQVLFHFALPPQFAAGLNNSWPTLSGSVTSVDQRTGYALNSSTTGSPGNPFSYVGIVWKSDFGDTRIMIDNFRLDDACPDCIMNNPTDLSGCFDNTWITPIANNYYAYTISIRDSASGSLFFREIHQPATFSWDGIGNQGQWAGNHIPYETPMTASITYYSCREHNSNVRSLTCSVTRKQGCTDPLFGGSRLISQSPLNIRIYPNPAGPGEEIYAEVSTREKLRIQCYDLNGKRILPEIIIASKSGKPVPILENKNLPPGVYFVQIRGSEFVNHRKIILY